ncbi:MAG: 50S ribosomal protein L6 [Candidatus Altiarchaeota archaeon]
MEKKDNKTKAKGIEIQINIPKGIEVRLEGNKIFVKGEKGELKKELNSLIKVEKINSDGEKVIIKADSDRKKIRAIAGTTEADIKNMIKGVSQGVTYKLRVVYSHFPINLKIQGDTLLIENFLGEKYPRKAKILEGVTVNIKGRDLELYGIDKEKVAQTAANIESATAIKNFDPRVFQDGIYIYEKDGKSLLEQ